MSGPKLSDFQIKELARKKLEEERIRKLKELQLAVDRFHTVKRELESRFHSIVLETSKLLYDIQQYEELFSIQYSLKEKVEQLTREVHTSFNTNQLVGEDVIQINAKTNQMSLSCEELFVKFNKDTIGNVYRYKDYILKRQQLLTETVNRTTYSKEEVQNVKDVTFLKKKENTYSVIAVIHEIQDFLGKSVLPQQDRQHLNELYNQLNSNLSDSQKKVVIDAFQSNKKRLTAIVSDFESLYSKYQAQVSLYNSIGEPLMSCEPISSFKNLRDLNDVLNKLEKKTKKKSESHFIYEQINEVFVSRGYSPLVNFVLNEDDQGLHFLSMIDSEKKMAYHLYTSGKDYIMIETVRSELKIGENHEVNFVLQDELSSDEQQELFDQQELFCTAHADLLEDISKKDIVLTERKYNKSDKRHSKKIEMSVDQTTFNSMHKIQNTRKTSVRYKEKEKKL
jgi:hypothetical protein